uniref:Uncharacterized protein n=1 Tax=Triticum urartu TaxID=4572 RepID=A0A8R7UXH9_TRIUA
RMAGLYRGMRGPASGNQSTGRDRPFQKARVGGNVRVVMAGYVRDRDRDAVVSLAGCLVGSPSRGAACQF